MSYFYAVAKGHKVGIFETWNECQKQVNGFRGAKYKKFNSLMEANDFVKLHNKRKLENYTNNVTKKRIFLNATKRKAIEVETKSNRMKKNLLEENSIPVVYTDGSCTKNGCCDAKAGYGVFWGVNHPDNVSCPVKGIATNNRAEYMAVICALQQAIKRNFSAIKIRTDSKLLIQSLTIWIKNWEKNGWKKRDGSKVLNVDLVKEVYKLMSQLSVEFEHVNSHIGIYGNEMADRLAKNGAERYQKN